MPSRRAVLATLAAGGLGTIAGCLGDEDPVTGRWPRAGYDDTNTGFVPESDGPGSSLTTSWRADVPRGNAYVHSTPVLVDERLYVCHPAVEDDGSQHVVVRVLDAATGETLERFTVTEYDESTSEFLYRDSLVAADGSLSVLAFDGLHSFTLEGDRRWHCPIDGVPNGSNLVSGQPVVAGDTVFVSTASITRGTETSEGVYAVDDETGDVRWRYDVPDSLEYGWTYSPAVTDDTVYVSLLGERVVALEAATGELEWETDVPATGPPTVADGRVFVPGETDDDRLSFVAALDAATGDERWRRTGDGDRSGRQLAVADGTVYAREGLEAFVARDAETGEQRWRQSESGYPTGTRPVVTDDLLYVGTGGGRDRQNGVAVLDPDTGEELEFASIQSNVTERAPFAVADDRLFVSALGEVVALEPCTREIAGRCLY
ncbi:outer membrane protein assembly factor BamB family protein [Natronobacterium texcoconense]|uniref:Outer membrane protein assembly factor BamB, contains PQQ-like beta-propeller repeat n=1 Tax=Natronobacterium texcoconense TaxID=1095778 RepID=A0A1H0ZZQ7_NATTX|nr:PQQ-binding-like beta-propeller repeat protein [Natronobacterium texcoconense]SDQ32964.1 Outer membrane protein assembly factor BamB, contains PQQ-like beta-propeller repeat [Natronobacterium texcoconense]